MTRRGLRRWSVLVGLCVLLTACASSPKQLPQCEGNWVPVNAPVEVRHGS